VDDSVEADRSLRQPSLMMESGGARGHLAAVPISPSNFTVEHYDLDARPASATDIPGSRLISPTGSADIP